tara:strand:+ start:809 stop:1030 length:222 start_codon:yes stop_codon:yes gene_type:complete
MNYELINDFYIKSTPEEKCQLLWLMAKDIMIPINKIDSEGKYYVDCMELDSEIPVMLNGVSYQINVDDFYKKD